MPIWWRIVDLPASIKTLSSDSRETAAQGDVVDSTYNDFNSRELFVLYVSSVVAGGLSLISMTVAVASFLRMRRSFRRDLILLLIMSDVLKTLWLIILPAIELVQGPVASTSRLCQISGYFLSVGIESCDFAVLLIAVHTGLYIFRGRTGLYPYRVSAYCVVAIVSLLLASLAFIHKPAFVNRGPFCYLSSQSGWTIRALSWIPRYVVVVTIMLTYTCIYAYVQWVMMKSGEPGRSRNANERRAVDGHHFQKPPRLTQTAPIAYQGIIPSIPPRGPTMPDRTLVLNSQPAVPESTLQSTMGEIYPSARRSRERVGRSSTLTPLLTSFPSVASNNRRHRETSDSYNSVCTRDGQDGHVLVARQIPFSAKRMTSKGRIASTKLKIQDQTGLILDDPSSENSDAGNGLPQVVLSPTTLNATGMRRVRDKIRRQLGQLFVYPLVYVTGWLIPFIAHVMRSDQTGRPFWLSLASLISMCVQGLADSLVFMMMEKPWRYWTRDDVTAWCCFSWSKQSSMRGTGIKVGRTREEMLIDGTMARRRREGELVERRLRSAVRGSKSRNWWDLTLVGVDESSDEDDEQTRTMT